MRNRTNQNCLYLPHVDLPGFGTVPRPDGSVVSLESLDMPLTLMKKGTQLNVY